MKSICHHSADDEFRQTIDAWVHQGCRDGIKLFGELLTELPGVYPADALQSIRRLHTQGLIEKQLLDSIESEVSLTQIPPTTAHGHRPVLLEHPLDFEWRFSRVGVSRILDEFEDLGLGDDAEMLCLGCPSVYSAGKRTCKGHFHLWDKNGKILGQLEESHGLESFDLLNAAVPTIAADAAVLDPPWYPEYYRLFLWAALRSVRVGGYIVLSFPPAGTRARVVDEFSELLGWCRQAGLRLKLRKTCYLPYRTPLFEVNALGVEGICNFPLDWRRGDLVVLEKQTDVKINRPDMIMLQASWEEVRIGLVRVMVRHTAAIEASELEAVGSSEVLGSVSSRHQSRQLANVVTSGNRFLRSRSSTLLLECLRDLGTAWPGLKSTPPRLSHPVSSLQSKVFDLIYREEQEAINYINRIHDL